MKATDLMINCLEAEGVERIFGVPGEENLDFVESLRNSDIELVVTRHEQAAGFMAATYGRLTGKPGVCLSTLGPGATNFQTAAAYAHLGGFPMILLTGQKPIRSSKQGRFQIIDIVETMKPVTKWAHQIQSGYTVPADIRNAFRLASMERPGAVHLELPEDVARDEVEGLQPLPQAKQYMTGPAKEAFEHAADIIEKAEKPLIVIGGEASRPNVQPKIKELIDKCQIPFISTQMGKGVVDERHELFHGTAALSAGDFVHQALEMADLIINIGHDVIEKPPFFMTGKRMVLHINASPARIDPVYYPQYELIGDVERSVELLTERLKERTYCTGESCKEFYAVRKELQDHIEEHQESDDFPMLPQRMIGDLRKTLPENGILALDNGLYKVWIARNFPAYSRQTVLLDNALATMGAGVPSAIGAKIVKPDCPVVAVCGDGGFMMNVADVITAVALKLDLVILILNDDALGMIKWKQGNEGFPDYGLDLHNPDFVKLAEAYGAHGHRIEKVDDFAPQLNKCIETGGVHLIDLPISYEKTSTHLPAK